MAKVNREESELYEKVVAVNRVAKVLKGGRRFSFSALVVVGDRNGKVGEGFGKAREVPMAIKKAIENARKNMITVPVLNDTVPHEIMGRFGAGKVLIKPAPTGTGVIAGNKVRSVFDAAGIRNVYAKSLGSNNALNCVRATIKALSEMSSPEHIARRRGKTVEEMLH